ncbi:MAG: hypothetical protein IKJ01_06950, partial [Lachnospiraceae bacterium]|nr:hypothetical protein [Lachnospiraceae bacterium]
KTIQSALETLGVKEDLDCDLLKEQDEWILEIIIKSVIMKMLLISNNNLPLVINLKAGNITIPVWTKKEQDNAYRLTSLFQKKNLCVQAYNGEMISVHLAMKKEDFLLISNMNYELIINEILQQNYTPTVDILVNTFILNGINAFDENQNMDLYNMLLTISNWQVEKQESDINILNNYQLVKRKRKLRIEEISKLNTIKMNNTQIDIRLGVAILLQSKIEMEAYWEELDGEQKKRFKEFPICYFAKELLN